MIFNSVSSKIDEVLSIKPSANVFAFGDFNKDHEDWLPYSGGTDRPRQTSAMAFPPLRNSDHVVISGSIDFAINSKVQAG